MGNGRDSVITFLLIMLFGGGLFGCQTRGGSFWSRLFGPNESPYVLYSKKTITTCYENPAQTSKVYVAAISKALATAYVPAGFKLLGFRACTDDILSDASLEQPVLVVRFVDDLPPELGGASVVGALDGYLGTAVVRRNPKSFANKNCHGKAATQCMVHFAVHEVAHVLGLGYQLQHPFSGRSYNVDRKVVAELMYTYPERFPTGNFRLSSQGYLGGFDDESILNYYASVYRPDFPLPDTPSGGDVARLQALYGTPVVELSGRAAERNLNIIGEIRLRVTGVRRPDLEERRWPDATHYQYKLVRADAPCADQVPYSVHKPIGSPLVIPRRDIPAGDGDAIKICVLGSYRRGKQVVTQPRTLATNLIWQLGEPQGYDYSRFVLVHGVCYGALVKLAQMKPDDEALLVTSGRCVPELVRSRAAVLQEVSVDAEPDQFLALDPDGAGGIPLDVEELLYATVQQRDVAIYRLDETIGELKKEGLDPFLWDPIAVRPGQSLEVVAGLYADGTACPVASYIYGVREANRSYRDLYRLGKECVGVQPAPGSPLIHSKRRTVAGLAATANNDGLRCDEYNACEVTGKGATSVTEAASYVQHIHRITQCFDGENELDLTRRGCPLPK